MGLGSHLGPAAPAGAGYLLGLEFSALSCCCLGCLGLCASAAAGCGERGCGVLGAPHAGSAPPPQVITGGTASVILQTPPSPSTARYLLLCCISAPVPPKQQLPGSEGQLGFLLLGTFVFPES